MSPWRMPAETAPQEKVWMAFPAPGYSLGDTDAARDEARRTWAAGYEPPVTEPRPTGRQFARLGHHASGRSVGCRGTRR